MSLTFTDSPMMKGAYVELASTLGLLGAVVVLVPLITRFFGRNSGWIIGAAYIAAAIVFTPAATAVFAGGTPSWSAAWVPALGARAALQADGLGVIFTYIALLIGAVVLFYSTRYFPPGRTTSFYWLMATFTFAMVGLVIADDLFLLFVCWEVTSLASFMLIARSGPAAWAPSLRTMFMTFFGGVLLLAAVALIAMTTGTTSVSAALASSAWSDLPWLAPTAAVLVAVAAFTKSAQFPFHAWLPDAMAAATPVSAYLHAAAVVKAGIFLLFRFSPAFHDVVVWNVLLTTVGLITVAVGGWLALTQEDVKKLMAFSTVSQLGLIVAAVGVGTPLALTAGLLHVVAHAMFKSGLFMMVGVIDHIGHTRIFGSIPKLARIAPFSFAVTVIGAASMAGIPPLMGFVSKEAIFSGLLSAGAVAGVVALIAAALASIFTIAYCVRIVFGAFIDGPEVDKSELSPSDPVMFTFAALPILASVPLVFSLGSLERFLTPGVASSLGESADVHLSLWHGFNLELAASIVIIIAGLVVIAFRSRVFAAFAKSGPPITTAQVLRGIQGVFRRCGVVLNRFIGSERALPHLTASFTLLAIVVYGGAIAVFASGGVPPLQKNLNRTMDVVLMLVIGFAVLSVCMARSRLTATISLSAVGILATVQLMALGAPDVTLTQLLVEAMTIIVFMLVLQKLPKTFWRYPKRKQFGRAVFAVVVGGAMALVTFLVSGRRERSEIAMKYLHEAPEISGGDNIVNTILVEFRALDTLGELTVLGMAGTAIVAVMSSVRDRYIDPPASEIAEVPRKPWVAVRPKGTVAHRAVFEAWPNLVALRLTFKVAAPILALTSFIIFMRGHNEPGGGFIAALVGSAIIGLAYMATSNDRAIGPPRLPLYLIGGGVMTAVMTGFLNLVMTGSFLEPAHGHFAGQHWTTSMIFDVGVYLAVVGLILVSFNLLGTSDSAFTPAGSDVLTGGRMHRDVDFERTRERTDEMVHGELSGPLDAVRAQRPTARQRLRPGRSLGVVDQQEADQKNGGRQ